MSLYGERSGGYEGGRWHEGPNGPGRRPPPPFPPQAASSFLTQPGGIQFPSSSWLQPEASFSPAFSRRKENEGGRTTVTLELLPDGSLLLFYYDIGEDARRTFGGSDYGPLAARRRVRGSRPRRRPLAGAWYQPLDLDQKISRPQRHLPDQHDREIRNAVAVDIALDPRLAHAHEHAELARARGKGV